MNPLQYVDDRVQLVVYRFFDVVKKRNDYVDECWSFVYPNIAEYITSREEIPFRLFKILQQIHEHSRANSNPNAPQIPDFGHQSNAEYYEALAAYCQHILDHADFENLPSFSQSPCFQILCNLVLASGMERKLFALTVDPEFVATFEHFKQRNVPQIIWSKALNVLNEDQGTRILSNTSNPDLNDLTSFFREFFDEGKDLKKLKKHALDKYHLKPHQVLIVAVDSKESCDALLAGFRVAQVSTMNEPEDPGLKKKIRRYVHHRMRISSISELRFRSGGNNRPQVPMDGFPLRRNFQDR